jgi:hypothetical protein
LKKLDGRVISGLLDLDALQALMQTVEDRRSEIQSPGRKAWRWLRRVKILGYGLAIDEPIKLKIMGRELTIFPRTSWLKAAGYPKGAGLLTWPEAVFNWILKRQPEGKELGKAAAVQPFSAGTMASRLLQMENRHRNEESSRLRSLRVVSVLMGILLAFLVQVNVVDILSGAFEGIGKVNEVVNTEMVVGWLNWVLRLFKWLPFLDEIDLVGEGEALKTLANGMRLDAGILLSGLAASAGSAFWHDQLERLQVAKKAAAQVQTVVETVRESKREASA